MIGLPLASWSPMTMVKSPMPGACAAAFTVGLPKPRSASHVAASMRSLMLHRSLHGSRLERSRSTRYRLRYVPGCNYGSPRDDRRGCRFALLGSDLFRPCSEVGWFAYASIHPAQVNSLRQPDSSCTFVQTNSVLYLRLKYGEQNVFEQ